jgi:NAD(P)-dependent dehydrogenase (short-subunit alcohol dehydrogenase family)
MLARGFCERGASVYVTTRDPVVGAEAAEDLGRRGRCQVIVSDLQADDIGGLVDEIGAHEGGLDVLINNAATTYKRGLQDHLDDALRAVYEVNFVTPFRLIRELLPLLAVHASVEAPAKIINIGSIGAMTFRLLDNFGYTAAKAGLHSVSRQLALVLARSHITVNVIAPGPFRSDMADQRLQLEGLDRVVGGIPLHRMGDADDIVGAAVYLASAAGNYVTAGVLRVDGGTSSMTSNIDLEALDLLRTTPGAGFGGDPR